MTITIRRATKNDMPIVFKMMNDLAATLKQNAPSITLEDLYRDGGFDGDLSYFFALLAEDSKVKDSKGLPTAIGFTLCSHSYCWDGRAIYMRNLLVNDSHRATGVGKMLFNAVLRYAKQTGVNRIELHVCKTNPAQKFYEKMGAINAAEKEGHVYYRLYKDVINKFHA
ncbi:uncharacterized protein LOC116339636 [Contarinia nasturtii]|uniref:uncharacterized protein LOC116339636 n=1 Tax=Contarinia nasturtii TaxID=265458 RepID=UPI0012D388F9|nr:uncharacterized protein LOC116339636 [Contarinia nasturtii]XP_031621499.1 uncharacterized protein LOC116339636 [Contarinia nasturtii]XP_031621500.1 uncharacterized protein LOC116339636 [Contarinia nasturtii]XP_031621501.1 uncharacterized protein LOC116339636 [Contarinia nasturtii]XP_031621502.1 uncharacterized protein LOC116339636 [Contarinia nasturtii]